MTTTNLLISIKAALAAGNAILDIYSRDFEVEFKADMSPLTLADRNAHQVIMDYLQPTGLPVLSEEGVHLPYPERQQWEAFWLVDPLDGTKEFVKRNGDFTVNIAFIQGKSPVAGVIYAPVPGNLYFASGSIGAYRFSGEMEKIRKIEQLDILLEESEKLPVHSSRQNFVVVASRSHLSQETSEYIKNATINKNEVEFLQRGSSLKFCSLAEGTADLYPRMGPTMEWDTAAGHAIAINAGCTVVDFETRKPLSYNKESLLNPWFIASR